MIDCVLKLEDYNNKAYQPSACGGVNQPKIKDLHFMNINTTIEPQKEMLCRNESESLLKYFIFLPFFS